MKLNIASYFKFIKKNIIYIFLILIFFIGIMTVSSIINKDNRDKTNPLNVKITESFNFNNCSADKSLAEKNEWCNTLRDSTCKINKCCNLLSGKDMENKCVGGSEQGPTFSEDYEYYTYRSECYTKNGKKLDKECPN